MFVMSPISSRKQGWGLSSHAGQIVSQQFTVISSRIALPVRWQGTKQVQNSPSLIWPVMRASYSPTILQWSLAIYSSSWQMAGNQTSAKLTQFNMTCHPGQIVSQQFTVISSRHTVLPVRWQGAKQVQNSPSSIGPVVLARSSPSILQWSLADI